MAACDKFIDARGSIIALNNTTTNKLNGIIETFSKEALRTLCLAYREMDDGFSIDEPIPLQGYTCIGIVGIKDPVRPGVRQSVATCRSAGILVRMITGDNINTAKAIARECGILTEDGIAIEGAEFREKNHKELIDLIPKMQVCHDLMFIFELQVFIGLGNSHVRSSMPVHCRYWPDLHHLTNIRL